MVGWCGAVVLYMEWKIEMRDEDTLSFEMYQ